MCRPMLSPLRTSPPSVLKLSTNTSFLRTRSSRHGLGHRRSTCNGLRRQAENMAHAFALVYGREYREPILRFLRHLQHLHEGNDHQYPFSFIADAWEEMFWHETEEIRHAVASLLKTMGKEASRKEDFAAAALVARSDGSGPALRLPTAVWDYEDMQGYFTSVILQRLHERAMRVGWDRTHKASLARPPRKQGEETTKQGEGPTPAPTTTSGKAGEGANASAPASQLKGYPAGKVLSQAEVGLSRQRAPLDAQGKMKCWEASSYTGCRMTAAQCSDSHEIIRVTRASAGRSKPSCCAGAESDPDLSSLLTRWTQRWRRCAKQQTVKPLRIVSPRMRGRIPRKLGLQSPVRSPRRRRRLPAPAEPRSRARPTPPTWEPASPPGVLPRSTSPSTAPLWRKHSDSGFWARIPPGIRTITRVRNTPRGPSQLIPWSRSDRRHSMPLPPPQKDKPSPPPPIDFALTCTRGWLKRALATKP